MRKLLIPFSWLYGGIIRLRNWLYHTGRMESYRADQPLISIGNLSTGGTGKTPLAEYVIQKLLEKGHAPAYLSRGYGRKTKGYIRVVPLIMDADTVGDEALQVANRFPEVPVAVCEARKTGLKVLDQSTGSTLFVLDDAFQHRRVARDLDLIVIDANRLPTRDYLLPAGNLREPITSLKRADFLIINKVKSQEAVPQIEAELSRLGMPMAFCRPVPQGLRTFSGEFVKLSLNSRAIVFSGIGNNAAFLETVTEAGVEIEAAYPFRDHYRFEARDIERIIQSHFHHSPHSSTFDGRFLLTTEKDYFRIRNSPWLSDLNPYPFAYVPIQLNWLKGEKSLWETLESILPPTTPIQ